jgi:hypothetical protein
MALSIPTDELNLIADIEDAIKTRLLVLKELGASVEVDPSTLSDQQRAKPQGRLTIACIGSSFTEPPIAVTNHAKQIETLRFQLDWRLRDLRTHQEAWRISQATLWLLSGWQPHDCHNSGLYPIGRELQGQDEQGYWPIYMMFGLRIKR